MTRNKIGNRLVVILALTQLYSLIYFGTKGMDISNRLYAAKREEFRTWLEKYHKTENEIWLIYYRKETGIPCISNHEAVEEALCFGWIDSLVKSIDERKYAKKFTPRRTDSNWSELNRRKAEGLIKLGLMRPAGFAKIWNAKKNGNWNKPRPTGSIFPVPFAFIKALADNKKARKNFENLAASYRKRYIGWISDAKKRKTREDRISRTIYSLEKNQKPGMK